MSEETRAYEKKRYARDKKKRIAAEKKYKDKVSGTAAYKSKDKARNKVESMPKRGRKCAVCGKTTGRMEFHHTSYNPPKGEWRCSVHNPNGGAVKK